MSGSPAVSLSVVVPVRDEEGNLREFHRRLVTVLAEIDPHADIVYVENGSTDGSWEVLRSLSHATALRLAIGKKRLTASAASLKAGFDHATGEIVVTFDADLQNDPADLPAMLQKLEEGFDAVIGCRTGRKDPLSQRIVSNIGRLLRRLLGMSGVRDPGCGLRVMRRRCIEDLPLFGEYHRFLPDILAMRGWKVGEHPITHHPRMSGESKYPWTKGPRALADLCALAFIKRFGDRPMQAFGTAGLVLMILGIAGWTLARFMDMPALRIASIIALIVGVQSLILGLVTDMVARTYFATHKPYRIAEVRKNEG